jgi:hypothetical protein
MPIGYEVMPRVGIRGWALMRCGIAERGRRERNPANATLAPTTSENESERS